MQSAITDAIKRIRAHGKAPGILVGEADGSTLFLDEFAEIPSAMQAHLLRVLDQGEYHRLGESKPRTSDFRLIAV